MSDTAFVFDLDGTVTTQELLPIIATHLDVSSEMRLLTELTLNGSIPFEDSFRLRCAILKSVPISAVRSLVADVELDPYIMDFITQNRDRCFIATGNLDCWIHPIVTRLGCRAFSSQGVVEGDTLKAVHHVLRKNTAVIALKERFKRVVAIGESVNDLPMFEVADIGIAFGGVHPPSDSIVRAATYVTYSGASLCRLLNTL